MGIIKLATSGSQEADAFLSMLLRLSQSRSRLAGLEKQKYASQKEKNYYSFAYVFSHHSF